MLTIRLTRIGKKKQPMYRFVIMEKNRDPWGKALEILGTYNPHTNPATFVLEKDRIAHWIGKGAQCSDSVWNMFVDQGLVKGEKRHLTTMKKRHAERIAKKQKA
mgnify:FL=1